MKVNKIKKIFVLQLVLLKKIDKIIQKYKVLNSIRSFLIKLWITLYKTIFTFNLHAGSENSSYLAFSMIFAIFPFMIFFMIIIGYFGQTEIGMTLIKIFENSLPQDITKTLLPVIDNVVNGSKGGILSIATLTLIWNSSSMVQGLKTILDRAYRIKSKKNFIFTRLVSVLQFLMLTIFFIVFIFFTIIFPKILAFIDDFIPIKYNTQNILVLFRPFLLNGSLFIFIISLYYIIPSRREKIKDIIWGSILTLVGWNLAVRFLTIYLLEKAAGFQIVYGSLAGIIITLFSFNIIADIFVFGAEFNYNVRQVFYKDKAIKQIDI